MVSKTVPLLDLTAQHHEVRDEVLAAVTRVIDSQKFILGDEVKQLEQAIAPYCGAKYAIGCASGSDALFLALLALDLQPGDEVVTTPYTFFATVGAICRAGAVPVFLDVEPETFNMDMRQLAALLDAHPRVRAIIPIHLFGGCADMDHLCELAFARCIPVIEDAAQSIGSEYKGRRAGSIGNMACFSFFPSKNLGAYGDGGMVTTNDAALAERLTALRVHGSKRKYYHDYIGINSRLDALQAAVLRVKFKYLDTWTGKRQHNAAIYRDILAGMNVPVVPPVTMPYQTRHVYNQFAIRAEDRDGLQTYLKQHGVGSEVYYPVPLHLQSCFTHLGYRAGDFPVSERLAKESLAVPIYSELQPCEIEYVCGLIQAFYGSRDCPCDGLLRARMEAP
jgi:dTDP-4-amino-4,6-dideoxygalactose transaminase